MKWILIPPCIASRPVPEPDSGQIDALGTPSEDGPSWEGPQGKYDTDPGVDFGRVSSQSLCEISPNL